MLSDKEIVCPNNLLDVAHKKKGVMMFLASIGVDVCIKNFFPHMRIQSV